MRRWLDRLLARILELDQMMVNHVKAMDPYRSRDPWGGDY